MMDSGGKGELKGANYAAMSKLAHWLVGYLKESGKGL